MATSAKGKKRITFSIQETPGNSVSVAGDFNAWNANQKPLRDKSGNGMFTGIAMLTKGRHAYKFVINDVWTVDPTCDDWEHDGYGSLNSVINVE